MSSVQRAALAWLAGAALAAGVLTWAGEVALGAFAVPAPPANLAAAVNGHTVTLSWQAGGGAAGVVFWLEAGSAPGAANLGTWPTTATQLVAAGVPDGRYFLRVRAASADGASAPSNEVDVRVGCGASLSAPQNLLADVNGNALFLAWEPVPGATAYLLEAGSAPGLANVATVPLGATTLAATVPAGTYYVRVRALSACGAGDPSNEVVLRVGTAPPTVAPIYGEVDPLILGTCSVAAHDRWVVDGGDGYRYRTWHPQVDPSGCVYAHEHGDDPATVRNPAVAASPVRFGFIGRRMDHGEVHEGFKVFVANRGDRNAEGRESLVDSRIVMHMGTGGPRRFTMPHHSLEMRVIRGDGVTAFVQGMSDSTNLENICASPRAGGKTVMMLDPACPVNSLYEIWSNALVVQYRGRVVFRGGVSTAVFDPITAFDPANPTRLLYMWDPAMQVINNHRDDWSGVRGCDREAYHGLGSLYNGSYLDTGRTTFYTDALGAEVAPTDLRALPQHVSRHYVINPPASHDGNEAFKSHVPHCSQSSRLGLKN